MVAVVIYVLCCLVRVRCSRAVSLRHGCCMCGVCLIHIGWRSCCKCGTCVLHVAPYLHGFMCAAYETLFDGSWFGSRVMRPIMCIELCTCIYIGMCMDMYYAAHVYRHIHKPCHVCRHVRRRVYGYLHRRVHAMYVAFHADVCYKLQCFCT